MTRKPRFTRLRPLTIVVATIVATSSAEAQLQSPDAPAKQPTIHDTKVRPRNDRTDGGFSSVPYNGKSAPTSDVKRIRTTREHATDGSTPPAVPSLIPPPGQQ
jgi:hypothetical protein